MVIDNIAFTAVDLAHALRPVASCAVREAAGEAHE